MQTTTITNTTIHKQGQSTTLVVLLHGFNQTAERLAQVRRVVEKNNFNADILAPNLPFSIFSMAHPSHVVADLLILIDQAFEKSREGGAPGYQHILLIGHSIGALFARKLYVCAWGEQPKAPFEPALKDLVAKKGQPLSSARPWAHLVDRVILLAAMNRGWSVSHHQSLLKAILVRIGKFIGSIVRMIFGRMPIVFSVQRGAPFLTQLRLQWLFMCRAEPWKPKRTKMALTIQLLGSVDDLVSPNDNIDLVAGQDFIYLDVPVSNHSTIVEMDDPKNGEARRSTIVDMNDLDNREARGRVFKDALFKCAHELQEDQLVLEDSISSKNYKVTDVVFVIHGIRDEGYWTQKIARRVMAKGNGNEKQRIFASETSSYGFFPILSFFLPSRRWEKVEWLMDQYAETCARYPKAERFHYVGHSHGTYLLARALKEYPACRFDRVVFAGSVVQRHYDWQQFIEKKQVGAVLNFVASGDWVVAFFPKGLQSLRHKDLGSAGHDGFREAPKIFQPDGYIEGGHSAALKESMWEAIAGFIVKDSAQMPEVSTKLLSKQRAWLVRYPVWPLVWLSLLVIIVSGVCVIIRCFPDYHWVAPLLLYGIVLRKIATKL